ncbi:MAG TPA: sigma-70 family RNA polymerase sigma factor [Planctomycetota bacterium]|nr:sigma-70 family RNA polymerase sigma factor [Planctomycetota bacterium]
MPRPPRDQFEALVREHHDAVYRAASRVLADSATAADVAQDVFVRVLQGKVHLDRAESVRATLCWLATMLGNNARRARRRRERHEENAMRTGERHDPAGHLDDKDLQLAVQRAVDELPPDLQLPLLLRCQDELTFASIGSALRVSESTAHERVQRALQRLRQALVGRGFAVAVGSLPPIVAAQPAPASPLGLQSRLLALAEGVPMAAVAWGRRALVAALGTASLAVVAFAANPFGGAPGGEPATAGPVVAAPSGAQDPPPAAPAPNRTVVTPAIPAAGQEPVPAIATHVFTGTVHDAAAWPLAGATVAAYTAGGQKPNRIAAATTDAAGAFRLQFRDPEFGARFVRLAVIEQDHMLLETADIALPHDDTAEPLRLVLPAAAGTATSRFVLAVRVQSSDGNALCGVPVRLFSANEPHPYPGQARGEVETATGADGTALLGGRALGAKWLFVDGREAGCAASFTPFAVDRAGNLETRIVLPAGRTLAGSIARLDGEPIEWANAWLEDEQSQLQHPGRMQPGGGVVFTGLGAGPYTLHVYAKDCSAMRRTGLRPGSAALTVALKRSDDTRDVGEHMGELHGRLVDAATGATVSFGAFCVEVLPRRDGESTLLLDAAEPPGPSQTMASDARFEQFHEGGLAPGRWVLVARVAGYAVAAQEFTLGEHTMRTDLTIPLVRGAEVRGTCTDAAGRPVPGASVFVVGVGELADRCLDAWRAQLQASERGEADVGAADPSVSVAWGFSDADGSFVLRAVPPGVAVRLTARAKGRELVVLPPRSFQAGERVDAVRVQFAVR